MSFKSNSLNLLFLIFLIIKGIVLGNGCTNSRTSTPLAEEVTQIVNTRELPQSLHPTYEVEIPAFNYIYLSLTTTLPDGNRYPVLTKHLPEMSDDQTQIIFTLRDDISWPDGTLLSVRDALFSLKVFTSPLLNHPAYIPYTEHIKTVEPGPGDNEFVIRCAPYYIHEKLPDFIPILPSHIYDPDGILAKYSLKVLRVQQNFEKNPELSRFLQDFQNIGAYESIKSGMQDYPTGLGPYSVETWIPGESLTLIAKDAYWASSNDSLSVFQQKPQKIHFILTDPIQGLRTSRADVITQIAPTAFKQLAPDKADQYHLKLVNGKSYACIALNSRPDPVNGNPIFTSQYIRQALSHLIPVKQIIQARYKDSTLAQPIALPISPDSRGINPEIIPRTYDPSLAQKILENARAIDRDQDQIREIPLENQFFPLIFTLIYKNTSPTYETIAQYTEASLRKIGIICKLKPLSTELFNKAISERSFDAAIQVYTFQPDAIDFKQLWHTNSIFQSGYNITGFGTAETDQLIDRLRIETDKNLQLELSYILQEKIYNSQTTLHLFSPKNGVAISRRFRYATIHHTPPYVFLNTLN